MGSDTTQPNKRRKTSTSNNPSSRDYTAKFSQEWRRIIRHRAHALKHDLESMYRMAIRLAAPEVVLYIASQVPLPESTFEEDCALQTLGPSSGGGFGGEKEQGDDDWVCPGYTTQFSFEHRGYEGVNVVYEAFGKHYDNVKNNSKKREKFVLSSASRVLDMRPEEIYASPHGNLQAKIQKRWPLKCGVDGRQSKLQKTEGKKRKSEGTSAEGRRYDAKSAHLDTDSCNNGRGTNGLMGGSDDGPITPASLFKLYADKCDAKAAYKQLRQLHKDRQDRRKQRWREREKRPERRLDRSARKSKLWQCWSASDFEEGKTRPLSRKLRRRKRVKDFLIGASG